MGRVNLTRAPPALEKPHSPSPCFSCTYQGYNAQCKTQPSYSYVYTASCGSYGALVAKPPKSGGVPLELLAIIPGFGLLQGFVIM